MDQASLSASISLLQKRTICEHAERLKREAYIKDSGAILGDLRKSQGAFRGIIGEDTAVLNGVFLISCGNFPIRLQREAQH